MQSVYVLWLRQLKKILPLQIQDVRLSGAAGAFPGRPGIRIRFDLQGSRRGEYIQFIAPGIVAMSIIFSSVFNGIEIIWDRQFGFLKETLVAPVSRLSIMFGRTLGGATVSTIQGILVLLVSLVSVSASIIL